MTNAQRTAIHNVVEQAKSRIITEGEAAFYKTSDGKKLKTLQGKIDRLEAMQDKLKKEAEFITASYETVYRGWSGKAAYLTPEVKVKLDEVRKLTEDLETKLAFGGKGQGELFMAFMKAVEKV